MGKKAVTLSLLFGLKMKLSVMISFMIMVFWTDSSHAWPYLTGDDVRFLLTYYAPSPLWQSECLTSTGAKNSHSYFSFKCICFKYAYTHMHTYSYMFTNKVFFFNLDLFKF